MERGGGKRRRDSSSPRRTQQRDRSAQQRERGAAPACAVADASPVWAAQREGRADNRARRAALETAAAGPVQPETTDELPRDETSEGALCRRRHPGRRRLPADLPRERIEIVPPASERHCTVCDSAKVRIREEITEELDYVPASFVIREYVRPRYACGGCQQGVVQAVLPARPIEKGRPGLAGARGHLQVRGSSAVVSAGADLRAPRSASHPAHALGMGRGRRRDLLGTHRARHAPGAGAPVAVDSTR